MSQDKFISQLIGLTEKNIHFDMHSVIKGSYHGTPALVVTATLDGHLSRCPLCGFNNCLVKDGHKTVTIKLNPQRFSLMLLKLRKQRFRCQRCHSIITAQTNIVRYNCQISTATWRSIIMDFHDNLSATLIAQQNGVSPSSVNRAYAQAEKETSNRFVHLPPHMGFDEFTSSHQNRQMRFIFQDADHHDRVVILYSRRKKLFEIFKSASIELK